MITPEECTKLINAVKEHRLLYDSNHEYYKDHHMREEVWLEIADQLKKSVLSCKKHWRSIRDGYARFRRNLKYGERPKHAKNKVKWYIYDQLTFLDVRFNTPATNSEDCNTATVESQDEGSDAGSEDPLITTRHDVQKTPRSSSRPMRITRTKISPERRRVFVRKDEILGYMERIDRSNDLLCKTVLARQAQEYNLGSFAAHVQAVLKKLSPVLQVEAKQELFSVLAKYELAAIENGVSSNASSPGASTPPHSDSNIKFEPM